MDRYVEPLNAYQVVDGKLAIIGRGVTHYRFPWREQVVGEALRWELVAAGCPETTQVTHYPIAGEVDVALPGDDGGSCRDAVARVADNHQGTEAADHVALMEFTGSVREAAKRMAEGGLVSAAERDIVVGVLVGRLV